MKTLTVSPKRQIAIPKEVCERLHIKGGDQLVLTVREGKIVLEPSINIPRSQAWFWSKGVQAKLEKAENNFLHGNVRRYRSVDSLLKDLKDA